MKPVLKENSICQQLHVRILSKMSNLFVWASETGRKATLGRTILSYLQQFQIILTFTSNIHILCILCLSSNDKESKQLPNFTEKSRTKCCSNLSSVSSFSSTLLRFLALPSVWISYQVSFINLWSTYKEEPSWLWSYGSWICNYLCNQCLSLQKLWVRIPLMVICTWYTMW
jgi:hypothetical protein